MIETTKQKNKSTKYGNSQADVCLLNFFEILSKAFLVTIDNIILKFI